MEMLMMLRTSIVLFLLAASGGLLMAILRFTGHPRPPSWLAMGHGLLAGAGVTLLIYAAVVFGIPTMAMVGLVILLIAAAGGAAMNLLFHSKQLPLPIPLMLVHATAAVTAVILLLISAF